jgi:hypothetical protein
VRPHEESGNQVAQHDRLAQKFANERDDSSDDQNKGKVAYKIRQVNHFRIVS